MKRGQKFPTQDGREAIYIAHDKNLNLNEIMKINITEVIRETIDKQFEDCIMKPLWKVIINKLKTLRIEKGFSQQGLAWKLGFKSRASVCYFETGKRQPTLKTLKKYAKVFGVSLGEIVK